MRVVKNLLQILRNVSCKEVGKVHKIWLVIKSTIRGTISGFKEGLKLCQGSGDVIQVATPYDILQGRN